MRSGRISLRRTVLAALVLGPACLAPLPFGSQDLFFATLWVVPLALAAAALDPAALDARQRMALGAVAALGLLLLLLVAVQFVLAAGPAAVASDGPPAAGPGGWSPVRRPDLTALMPAVAPFAACLAGAALATRAPVRAMTVVRFTGVLGAAYAGAWLLLHASDPDFVLWRLKTHHHGVLTGTFLNRNVAAAFLAVATVALAIGSTREAAGRRAVGQTRQERLLRALPWLAGLATTSAALLMTLSRAGAATALLGVCAVVVALVGGRWRRSAFLRSRRRIALLIGLGIGGLLASLLMFDILSARISDSGRVDAVRFEVYKATAAMIAERPWLGWGAGRFADVFPAFRGPSIGPGGIWDRAHNTYLQTASEMGLPLAIAGCAVIAMVLATLVSAARRDPSARPDALLAAAAVAMAALHALLDYPMQIPGYAIPVSTLVGFVLARREPPPRPDGQRRGSG